MPSRKRKRKTYAAKTKLQKGLEAATSKDDQGSPAASDSVCPLNQDSPKDQAKTANQSLSPQLAPAARSSTIGEKRKRELSSGNNPEDQPSQGPSGQARGHEEVSAKKQCPEPTQAFTSAYTVGELLGSGGHASVYAGTRKSDGEEVAIKFMPKSEGDQYFTTRSGRRLPLEVALMTGVSRPPSCHNVIKLLDWFEEPLQFILILERPSPCSDLFDICVMFDGRLSEMQARYVMWQVVEALIHCRDRGVFHRDVKSENILVNLYDWTVKLIDFGCGTLYQHNSYHNFRGTLTHCPPEYFLNGCYQASPATTWSVGVLLFQLVCGYLPFESRAETIRIQPKFMSGVSKECQELITWCMSWNPHDRPTLEEILAHTWLSEEN